MGIFYKTTQDIMFESGLTYDLAEIVTEAFNPIAAVKKFFAAILKKIKDFFTKIFSKKSPPAPTHKTPEPKPEQPSLPPEVSKDYEDAKKRYEVITKKLLVLERLPTPAPELPRVMCTVFLADDAMHYLKTSLDDLSKTYIDLITDAAEEMQRHADHRKTDMAIGTALREVNMDDTMDAKIKKITHRVTMFKESQPVKSIKEPEKGKILKVDISEIMPKKEDYAKHVDAAIADFVKYCDRGTMQVVTQHKYIFNDPSIVAELNRHFVRLTQDVSSMMVDFTRQFNASDVGISDMWIDTIDTYNEKRIRYIEEQNLIKQYKSEKESLVAAHGSFE